MPQTEIWQSKLLAYIHDPAEKALILLRGAAHEAGTVSALKELFGQELSQIRSRLVALEQVVKRADWWAAAADRVSLPKGRGGQVAFAAEPQIIHPLTGEKFSLRPLVDDAPVEAIEALSLHHFRQLVILHNGEVDWRKTFLAFWRFGPETPAKGLGSLWSQLPADTRTPDHTIWEHLSLTSAFAGAMAGDPEGIPALMLISFGPVQDFIAQARSVSDLWAGSHLLSRIAWEGMRLVCEDYGPDAILFPQLRGIALTDLWLLEHLGRNVWPTDVKPSWMTDSTDSNPLFAAAFPNRFLALVPKSHAQALAARIQTEVRRWVRTQSEAALEELLQVAGLSERGDSQNQIERQTKNFPEVHWAIIPYEVAGRDHLDDDQLREILRTFGTETQYLGEALDDLLRGRILVEGVEFYAPNPGVAFPGLYQALEATHGSAKMLRPFSGVTEEGYRCTLCGEREWLAIDRGDPIERTGIFAPPQQRGETLWSLVSKKAQALAKEGEHLCTLCALKRCWPRLFVKECTKAFPELGRLDRFVLSTHAVAISTSIWQYMTHEDGDRQDLPEITSKKGKALNYLQEKMESVSGLRGAALPKRLYGKLRITFASDDMLDFCKRIPALMDAAQSDSERDEIRQNLQDYFGARPETYYGLILLDGDQMGAWLAGDRAPIRVQDRFHDTTLENIRSLPGLQPYLAARRPVSPAYHQAISSALNCFSNKLARLVTEELFMGKLIYAGGDDLLAMVAVHDLPGLMFALRCSYSGVLPVLLDNQVFWKNLGTEPGRVELLKGHALVHKAGRKELYRLMGDHATASIGAVIAHHQAPLGRVLTSLREAENRAKTLGGRDAFCLTVMKRSGGTEHLVGKWALDRGWSGSHMALLIDVRNLIARDVSRRSAYILTDLIAALPPQAEVLESVLRYQFRRQAKSEESLEIDELCNRLAQAAQEVQGKHPKIVHKEPQSPAGTKEETQNLWLRSLLLTADFLAREGRISNKAEKGGDS
jgi:CRISPR-associated protein Cmr2